jgi:hypothetical protein
MHKENVGMRSLILPALFSAFAATASAQSYNGGYTFITPGYPPQVTYALPGLNDGYVFLNPMAPDSTTYVSPNGGAR